VGNVFVGPPPDMCSEGLVARSGKSGWYRVAGWGGEGMMQPLIWQDGALCMFKTNQVVEVTYDLGLWQSAKGAAG